jgi:hypothetical protein
MKSSSDASNQWFTSLFVTSVERQSDYQMSETDERSGAAQKGLLHFVSVTAPYRKKGRPFNEATP